METMQKLHLNVTYLFFNLMEHSDIFKNSDI